MKRIITITAMGIYMFAAIVSLARGFISSPAPIRNTAETIQPSTAAINDGYLVKSVGGVVAVEELKSGEIIKTTDTRVAILPAEDRRRLEEGIEADDERRLRKILEDLCS